MAITVYTRDQVIAIVRRRIGDSTSSGSDTFIADGLTAAFPTSNYACSIITNAVTVDGVAQLEDTDYTVSTDGVIYFTAGNIPSAAQTVIISYTFVKLTDDEIWPYVGDGVYMVNMTYDFGGAISNSMLSFDSEPAPIAGTVYALQAAILIMQSSVKPLTSGEGIMIRHGDEVIDTKTSAITKREAVKGMQQELDTLITRYVMGQSQPWVVS